MKFNNSNKRDILILVKFDNIDIINKIQKKYYDLYGIVEPHIAVTFPFESDISDDELYIKLKDIVKNYKPFKIICSGVSTPLVDSDYRFLNVVYNKDIIKRLSDEIYKKIIPHELEYRDKYQYNPHISLCNKPIDEELIVDDEFEMIVDSLYVERIGENDESIFLYSVDL
jgi:2'-5' RNA ligase